MNDLFLIDAAHAVAELLLELLQLCFAIRTVDLVEATARVRIGFRMADVTAFANPAVKLRGVEKAIAAVNHRGRHAILEFQVTSISALRPSRIPQAGHGAHAPHHASAEKAQSIDMVRPLVKYHAMTRIEILIRIGPNHKVIVVPGMDHADAAQFAALNDVSYLPDRRIEAMGMAT